MSQQGQQGKLVKKTQNIQNILSKKGKTSKFDILIIQLIPGRGRKKAKGAKLVYTQIQQQFNREIKLINYNRLNKCTTIFWLDYFFRFLVKSTIFGIGTLNYFIYCINSCFFDIQFCSTKIDNIDNIELTGC